MGYSIEDTATVCLSVRGDIATLRDAAERILPMSVCQRVCFHSVGFSSGVTATLWVTAEGILSHSGLQERGYCHSLGYIREDTATLWVIAEGILPLSVFQRGCYHFLGYSRGDTVFLSENTHHVHCTVYL